MFTSDISEDRKAYLVKKRRRAFCKNLCRTALFVLFILLWEFLGRWGIIDPFIFSSPVRILDMCVRLFKSGELQYHTMVTSLEALTGFAAGTAIGILVSSLLWRCEFFKDVAEPYLVILNALPKIALGPVFIVWLGSGFSSIVVIALTVSVVVSILEILSGFLQTDKDMIRLVESMGGTKRDVLFRVVFPANIKNIVSSLKINMGMSWVGVIVGEFLISKAGLGYLIVYGSQVFKLDLVMASVVILALAAGLMYLLIEFAERLFEKKSRHF